MLWNRFLGQRSFQVSVNGFLSQMAEAVRGVSQGSALSPILFISYVNHLADNLTVDVKLIALRIQAVDLLTQLLIGNPLI